MTVDKFTTKRMMTIEEYRAAILQALLDAKNEDGTPAERNTTRQFYSSYFRKCSTNIEAFLTKISNFACYEQRTTAKCESFGRGEIRRPLLDVLTLVLPFLTYLYSMKL